ncbi:MAG: DUF5060 domain-containing protein [Planctomycetota bacterium]
MNHLLSPFVATCVVRATWLISSLFLFNVSFLMAQEGATIQPTAKADQKVAASTLPLVDDRVVFEEKDGLLAVEAEHFFRQTADDVRKFYLTTSLQNSDVKPDGDPTHVGGASNGAYLEILPDTRRNHGHKLIRGENFSPQPGELAILEYKVNINDPGRYYVWVRAYSTGSEDNGLHVGIDGTWPKSGQRLQWCQGKHTWRWESKQRTEEEHCGVPHKIFLDIEKPGQHTIHFSMREDGFEFDKWLMTKDRNFARPDDAGPATNVQGEHQLASFPLVKAPKRKPVQPVADPAHTQTQDVRAKPTPTKPVSSKPLILPRKPDGDGAISVTGDLMAWHKVTLSVSGPYAHEQDNQPNPFTDYAMWVTFRHGDGTTYRVPGYFAADGNAAESSAESGTVWRAHFAPDRAGDWEYSISFQSGTDAALATEANADFKSVELVDGKSGSIQILESDKKGFDFRAHGRLNYVGKRYLQHAGSGKYFLKIGADAPETLLAYRDFDATLANKPSVGLKSFKQHLQHWDEGDPQWQGEKGRGLIGAVRYLSEKGGNAFSFLPYNAGGDGDNVWPFIQREDKLHYDCSKLDQWAIVFDFANARGMYLHFKLQETEMDDSHRGHKDRKSGNVPTSLDGGELGQQRKLYLRELVARFGHELGLNWNLGEENTQSVRQQLDMINYIDYVDAYDHLIVVHTFPDQQDKVYRKLIGDRSKLTGVSLQNSSIDTTHRQTLKWVRESKNAKKPWVVAFDESGTAAHGVCPDLGFQGFDGKDKTGKYIYTEHEVRNRVLWGTLMAGGAGCEYYFGYQFAENDLHCEDWASRDRSWDYGRIAINFFHDQKLPFWRMENQNAAVGNLKNNNQRYGFGIPGETYLVYLAKGQVGGNWKLDLEPFEGEFDVRWFDPRNGGELQVGDVAAVSAGQKVALGSSPAQPEEDWVVLVTRKPR